MEHLFFNLDGGLEHAAAKVFWALGMDGSLEGDSSNSPTGVYDYEDSFEYMLSIKKSMLTELNVPVDTPSILADIASKMLVKNLGIKIGVEVQNEIRLIVDC
jgi:hypothetical protein